MVQFSKTYIFSTIQYRVSTAGAKHISICFATAAPVPILYFKDATDGLNTVPSRWGNRNSSHP